ncbi:protein of unknown function [Modestobacter italicus]|uniref:Uncharacterized protein n=1 Tax=Modestobacter italicus (strain DSM 44449 / CECT 9708 / BC 501) TaxID=2732864 RepID=I4ER70_MODI5|nr:protein of unknown function [Modestobacter marinus]
MFEPPAKCRCDLRQYAVNITTGTGERTKIRFTELTLSGRKVPERRTR